MRLNLGCGNDIRDGYTNVDFRKTHPDVLEVDLSKFPWPFEDSSVDEILMLDFLEHFPYRDTQRIILEVYRVLTPNGQVVIQVPDARHLMHALVQEGDYLCNNCGTKMHGLDSPDYIAKCQGCGQRDDDVSAAAMRRLYGGQDFPGNFHYTCFTENSLDQLLYGNGFSVAQREEAEHQYRNWNMKRRYSKGEMSW